MKVSSIFLNASIFNVCWASLVAQLVKSLPANTGGTRDVGLIPGSGRFLEKEMATHSSILAWKIPWRAYARVHGFTKSRIQLRN